MIVQTVQRCNTCEERIERHDDYNIVSVGEDLPRRRQKKTLHEVVTKFDAVQRRTQPTILYSFMSFSNLV